MRIATGCSHVAPGIAVPMTSPLPSAVAERLEAQEALDAPAKAVGKQIRNLIPGGAVKDALSGTWMGHALHPLLTDVPIGTYTSSLLLDLLGPRGSEKAADRLIAMGLAATPATVVTGLSDWADTEVGNAGVRRSGIVHASFNAAATVCMTASWVAHKRGARGRGKLWSLVGMSLLGGGGWLGGHISYAQGVGVDTTVFDVGPEDWTGTGVREAELLEGRPRCVMAESVPVLLVRDGGVVRALHNRCVHRGGPLSDGEVSGGTVTCPWHGSVFRLEDGSIERGPAAYPQPALETRVRDGQIEVRATSPA
jgi:nitrite reductase/ring-hydroxylating ferredoxin subunit/uncharacterized membrane protein